MERFVDSRKKRISAEGSLSRGPFTLNSISSSYCQTLDIVLVSHMEIWHQRLGHVRVEAIMAIIRNGAVIFITVDSKNDLFNCTGCLYGKSFKAHISPKLIDRSPAALNVVHTNISGTLLENLFSVPITLFHPLMVI